MNYSVLGFGNIVWFYVLWNWDIFHNIIKILAVFLFYTCAFFVCIGMVLNELLCKNERIYIGNMETVKFFFF